MNNGCVSYSELELNLELKPARKPERKKKIGSGKLSSSKYKLDNNIEILDKNSNSNSVCI